MYGAAMTGVAGIAMLLAGCNRREDPPARQMERIPAAAQRSGGGRGGSDSPGSALKPGEMAGTTGNDTTPTAAGGSREVSARASPVVANSGCDAAPVQDRTRFAVLGDYGYANNAEASVAALVKSLEVDFVLTTGDNNYPSGGAETIDANIGQFFHEFICPYRGTYGPGSRVNRFFPTLGNHDWYSPAGSGPYRDYFTLPGNERYYDFVWGDVHVFAIDSDANEPDGITATSIQATWLKQALGSSKAKWKIVAMHHPPFSSASHGSTVALQWPYKEWGAHLVLAGHDHTYERLDINGLVYVVTGLGGASIYAFGTALPGSAARYNETFGVAVVEADASRLTLQFLNVHRERIDEFSLPPR